jgi:hypothetical protein
MCNKAGRKYLKFLQYLSDYPRPHWTTRMLSAGWEKELMQKQVQEHGSNGFDWRASSLKLWTPPHKVGSEYAWILNVLSGFESHQKAPVRSPHLSK